MIQVLLIGAFVVLFLREEVRVAPVLRLSPAELAGVAAGGQAAIWALAQLLIWRQGKRLNRGQYRALERADRILTFSRVLGFLLHAFAVVGLGWLEAVRDGVGNLVLLDELLAAAPYLAMVVMGWWSMAPLERALREAVLVRKLDRGEPVHPIPSRAGFVLGAARHQLAMVLAPLLLIMTWREVVELAARRGLLPGWLPLDALDFGGVIVAMVLMPLLLRRLWDTVALGPGPLRDSLVEMCRAHGVRVRELLLWRTHGMMMNGAVMGLIGPARYVMLTDALVDTLPPDQLRAVMAHELGHIRRWHMPWLFAAAGLSFGIGVVGAGLGVGLLERYRPGLPDSEAGQVLTLVLGLLAAVVAFGFVSRRFEWQADAFAVQHLSGHRPRRPGPAGVVVTPEAVRAMSGALEAVAVLNHIPRERFGWRHGSIAARQRRLERLVGRRADRLRADREALVVKLVTGAALAAVVVVSVAGLV
jgi:Zn-dependent protease with chaperone function